MEETTEKKQYEQELYEALSETKELAEYLKKGINQITAIKFLSIFMAITTIIIMMKIMGWI